MDFCQAIVNTKINGKYKYLLLMYSHVADNDGVVHGMTDQAMSELMGVSRRSIFRSRNKLIEFGLLESLPGLGNYQLKSAKLSQNEKCQIVTKQEEKCQIVTKSESEEKCQIVTKQEKSDNLSQNEKTSPALNGNDINIYINNKDKEKKKNNKKIYEDLNGKNNNSDHIVSLISYCPPPKFSDSSEPETPEKPKRPLTKRQKTLSHLEGVFISATSIDAPLRGTKKQNGQAASLWWNPLWEIFERLGNSDLDLSERLIVDTVKYMRDNSLTIKAPISLLGNAPDIKAQIVQQEESGDYWTRAVGGGAF